MLAAICRKQFMSAKTVKYETDAAENLAAVRVKGGEYVHKAGRCGYWSLHNRSGFACGRKPFLCEVRVIVVRTSQSARRFCYSSAGGSARLLRPPRR